MLERDYQKKLKGKIQNIFPGCIVLKNDSSICQGIPDLSVYYHGAYAMLEVKKSLNEPKQPNQEYYVNYINENGGFARFIFPENEEEVLNELKEYFG